MNFIFFEDKIETLGFFSARLARVLSARGFETYVHGFYRDPASLFSRIREGETVLITFNCIGVSGEPEYMRDGASIWKQYGVTVVNILVDHPMYYHEQLESLMLVFLIFRIHPYCVHRPKSYAICKKFLSRSRQRAFYGTCGQRHGVCIGF